MLSPAIGKIARKRGSDPAGLIPSQNNTFMGVGRAYSVAKVNTREKSFSRKPRERDQRSTLVGGHGRKASDRRDLPEKRNDVQNDQEVKRSQSVHTRTGGKL